MKIHCIARNFLSIMAISLMLVTCSAGPESQSFSTPTDAELEQYNASVSPEDRIVCSKERPVGSRISQRVCRRVGDVELTSFLSQRTWRRIIQSNR